VTEKDPAPLQIYYLWWDKIQSLCEQIHHFEFIKVFDWLRCLEKKKAINFEIVLIRKFMSVSMILFITKLT